MDRAKIERLEDADIKLSMRLLRKTPKASLREKVLTMSNSARTDLFVKLFVGAALCA